MERRTGRLESVPMIGHVVSWAKQLSLRFGQSNELQKLDPDEINRIVRDFGISVSELLTLAKTSAGVQELLKPRFAEVGLSEELLQMAMTGKRLCRVGAKLPLIHLRSTFSCTPKITRSLCCRYPAVLNACALWC